MANKETLTSIVFIQTIIEIVRTNNSLINEPPRKTVDSILNIIRNCQTIIKKLNDGEQLNLYEPKNSDEESKLNELGMIATDGITQLLTLIQTEEFNNIGAEQQKNKMLDVIEPTLIALKEQTNNTTDLTF